MTVMLAERPTAPVAYAMPQRAGALSLSHLTAEDAWRFCQSLAQSALLPREYRDNPGSVLWAMEYGRALGLDVVTTITTIHVINGRPTQSADLMLSRAREAGHKVRVQIGDGQCTVSIWRHDDAEFENRVTWTFADAERAKLLPGKPDSNWQKYPRAMLRARAVAECVRSACPEVLHGAIYTPEELGAVVDQDGIPVAAPEGLQRQAPGQDAWEQAAPARPATEPVRESAPPAATEPWDAAAEGDISGGRDWINEATEAPTVDAVREVWQQAKAAGAIPATLDAVGRIGVAKAAEEKQARETAAEQPPAEPPAAEPVADTLPGAPAAPSDRLGALADLYAAGEAAGLNPDETRMVLAQTTKKALPDNTAEDIAAVAADLRAAGGAR